MADSRRGTRGSPAVRSPSNVWTRGPGLSSRQLLSLVDGLHLAVLVFNGSRVVYQNAAGRALVGRLREEYGIELSVTLRDHLAGCRALPSGGVPPVTLLTPPTGGSFYVHVMALPAVAGDPAVAVSVRELGVEREAFKARFGLSRRETEVLELLLRGYANRDIAATLGITPATTKKHLTHIFDKVGVDSRVRLITRVG